MTVAPRYLTLTIHRVERPLSVGSGQLLLTAAGHEASLTKAFDRMFVRRLHLRHLPFAACA
ncbi:hypothetical protein DIE08_24875 [Burkholderia sp. Bp9004]|nr:hypothetical protein DIE08_24875 [Burkholderia sp. Bp9004]